MSDKSGKSDTRTDSVERLQANLRGMARAQRGEGPAPVQPTFSKIGADGARRSNTFTEGHDVSYRGRMAAPDTTKRK